MLKLQYFITISITIIKREVKIALESVKIIAAEVYFGP